MIWLPLMLVFPIDLICCMKLRCFIETQSLSAERAVSGKSSNEKLPLKGRKLKQGSAEVV